MVNLQFFPKLLSMLLFVVLDVEFLVHFVQIWCRVETFAYHLSSSGPMEEVVELFGYVGKSSIIEEDVVLLSTLLAFRCDSNRVAFLLWVDFTSVCFGLNAVVG